MRGGKGAEPLSGRRPRADGGLGAVKKGQFTVDEGVFHPVSPGRGGGGSAVWRVVDAWTMSGHFLRPVRGGDWLRAMLTTGSALLHPWLGSRDPFGVHSLGEDWGGMFFQRGGLASLPFPT